MAFKEVFEDEHLLLLNKESGVHSIGRPDDESESVTSKLLRDKPEAASASPKTEEAGLLNRLDFETSGLILAAKSRQVWEILKEQLGQSQIQKDYLCVLEGHAPETDFLNAFIGSPYRRAKKVKVYISQPPPKARCLPAESYFHLLEYLPQSNCSLVKASAACARRHQIRAHAAHIKCPLLGDLLYNSGRKLEELFPEQSHNEVPQFFLHAYSLAFKHPITGEALEFFAPLPEAFAPLFENRELGH